MSTLTIHLAAIAQRAAAYEADKAAKSAPVENWTCPTNSRMPDDIVGCGHSFDAAPDWEGWVDCPECGLAFSRAGLSS